MVPSRQDLIKDRNFDEATMVPTAPMGKELVVRKSIEEEFMDAMESKSKEIAVWGEHERRLITWQRALLYTVAAAAVSKYGIFVPYTRDDLRQLTLSPPILCYSCCRVSGFYLWSSCHGHKLF